MKLKMRLKVVASLLFLSAALAACGGGGGSEGGQAGSAGDAGSAGQSGSAGSTGGSAGQGGSTGGAAGSTGGTAGSGGSGGSGGTGGSMSLANGGITQNDCAPNDGPAISVRIGQASHCAEMNDPSPQVLFLVYPAQTDTIKPGDKWTQTAYWLPDGAGGAGEATQNGTLEVVSADGAEAVFKYSFQTMAGDTYSGTATLLICASMPLCG